MPTQQFSSYKQVNFQWDDDEVHFVLDQHVQLDFYSASSLNRMQIDMSPYSDILSWFRAKQQHIPIL
jgi:hypothetical protein